MKTILQQEQINKLHEFGIDAVTLSDLLSILPKKITDRRNIYQLRMGITDCLGGGEHWYVEYKDSHTDIDDLDSFVSAEELIDAVYQEICFLKTNKIKEL